MRKKKKRKKKGKERKKERKRKKKIAGLSNSVWFTSKVAFKIFGFRALCHYLEQP